MRNSTGPKRQVNPFVQQLRREIFSEAEFGRSVRAVPIAQTVCGSSVSLRAWRRRLHNRRKVARMVPRAPFSRQSQADDDQIARWHDRDNLLVVAQHVIRVLRHRGLTKPR
jgi:hypothetical protein